MKKLLLTATVLVALATPAASGPLDGKTLLKECNKASHTCYGYILAVAEMAIPQSCGLQEAAQRGGGTIKGTQMRDVVLRYLYSNPQRLHLNSKNLVLEAFDAAWPCSQKQREAPSVSAQASIALVMLERLPAADREVVVTALLAEYLTSCGSDVRLLQPHVVKRAQEVIDGLGYSNWITAVSGLHVKRDELTLSEFCGDTGDVLRHYKMISPQYDLRPYNPADPYPPPPGGLNLSSLPRT